MKRTNTKEILIEIETIRVTRKRSIRKKTTHETKQNVSNYDENSFVENDTRLKQLFEQLF